MSAKTRTLRRMISSGAVLGVLLYSGAAVTARAVTALARGGATPRVVYTPVELRRYLTRTPASHSVRHRADWTAGQATGPVR